MFVFVCFRFLISGLIALVFILFRCFYFGLFVIGFGFGVLLTFGYLLFHCLFCVMMFRCLA